MQMGDMQWLAWQIEETRWEARGISDRMKMHEARMDKFDEWRGDLIWWVKAAAVIGLSMIKVPSEQAVEIIKVLGKLAH